MASFRWSKLSKTLKAIFYAYQSRLCSHTLLLAKPDKHRASLVRPKRIIKPSFRDNTCLWNKNENGSPVANQQSCSFYIRCLFCCVVPRPDFSQCLNDPFTPALTCFSDSRPSSHQSLTVSLSGACLWPLCINVKLSLYLLYTAVIILL